MQPAGQLAPLVHAPAAHVMSHAHESLQSSAMKHEPLPRQSAVHGPVPQMISAQVSWPVQPMFATGLFSTRIAPWHDDVPEHPTPNIPAASPWIVPAHELSAEHLTLQIAAVPQSILPLQSPALTPQSSKQSTPGGHVHVMPHAIRH